ncbi:riboflavin kinase [Mollisia scopiformis]|uniref:Riboflavin kinase n=1 Tax=Mollisia scopiformis TaxID=149040 RepID=A0A194WY21_MOLSC|nr:riboflavin kinase [Mollisia scopiformis]KUJ12497.1 riboflavin kinase [Mollisia scopiformis]
MRRPDAPRPEIIGDDSGPTKPFPLRMGGQVVQGFGRGSKELGIPTANLPVDTAPWIASADSGVYFGWSSIQLPPDHPSLSPSGPEISSTTFPTTVPYPSAAVQVPPAKQKEGWRIYPMVMSIGFNPFYGNTVRSAEVHVMHGFGRDFYGCEMRVVVLGYIRPEYDYESLGKLVEDIGCDIEVTGRSLGRERWGNREAGVDGWLWGEEEEGRGESVL